MNIYSYYMLKTIDILPMWELQGAKPGPETKSPGCSKDLVYANPDFHVGGYLFLLLLRTRVMRTGCGR